MLRISGHNKFTEDTYIGEKRENMQERIEKTENQAWNQKKNSEVTYTYLK